MTYNTSERRPFVDSLFINFVAFEVNPQLTLFTLYW